MLPTGEDRLSGDVPSHLAQPCYVALGQALIWGLYPDWFEGFVNWVPLPKLEPAVDSDGVTAFITTCEVQYVIHLLSPSIIRPLKCRNLNFREKSTALVWIRTPGPLRKERLTYQGARSPRCVQ